MLIGIALAPIMFAWVCMETGTSSANMEIPEFEIINDTGTGTSFGFTWNDACYQEVSGDSTNAPSWSTKFTPLSYLAIPQSDSGSSMILPAHQKYVSWLKYTKETGREKWKETSDPELQPVVTRNRRWDTNILKTGTYYNYP